MLERRKVVSGEKQMLKEKAGSRPQLDGRERLILTAEALFAKGGIDGVSLREIAAKAGQGNHNAVQYHFGSRTGLVHAVFDYRMLQMEPPRQKMLAAAEAAGTLKDARTIIEIIFLPQLALLDTHWNHSYSNFLCQYLLRNTGTKFGDFGTPLPAALDKTLALLRQRLDFLSEGIAQRRLVTACFMFLNMLSIYMREDARASSGESFESALDDTLEQIALTLCMPLRGKKSG
jgi:AcrR family transcriptional regulator